MGPRPTRSRATRSRADHHHARAAVAGSLLLAAALLVGAALGQRGMGGYGMGGHGSGGYRSGGSQGWGMMGPGFASRAPRTLAWGGAQAMIRASASDAAVDPQSNTVTFEGANETLDVIAVQPDKPDTTFEIAGLVNPTVRVQRGALVTIELVNMDYGEDMPHGLVVTRVPPPYPAMPMPMMAGEAWGGIPPLPARSRQDLQAARYAAGQMRFRAATPGTYYYLCQVPGHARDGMVGRLIVE